MKVISPFVTLPNATMSIGTSHHVGDELCIDASSVSCIQSDMLIGMIIIAFLIVASPKFIDYYPSTSPKAYTSSFGSLNHAALKSDSNKWSCELGIM